MDWEDTGGPLDSEDLAGLSIIGEEDLFASDIDDPAAMWLAAQGEGEIGTQSKDPAMGGMTAADLQLGRFSHMEPRIQRGIQSALYGTLDASKIGKDSLGVMAAVEEFTSVTGVDPQVIASRMKIDESVEDPRSRQDLGMVISMLQNTAGEYMERGPGKNLPGNYLNPDKMASKTEKLSIAFQKLGGIADLYIPEETKQSSIYGLRKEQVVNQLADRFMNQKFFDRGKDVSARADYATLPLPNELNVPGLVPTRSSVYGSTSPHTRLEQSAFYEAGTEGYSDYEIRQLQPSLINSLVPIRREDRERVNGKNRTKPNIARGQEFQMGTIIQDTEFVRKALLEAFPTMQNESEGVGRAIGFNSPYADQAASDNLRNEAAILGIDRDTFMSVSDNTPIVAGQTLPTVPPQRARNEFVQATDRIYGAPVVTHAQAVDFGASVNALASQISGHTPSGSSGRGGMHGVRGESELSLFVDALDIGLHTSEMYGKLPPTIPERSDRALYRSQVANNPSPAQGTPEWLAQREGNITASTADVLLREMGAEKMAATLARDKLGQGEKFIPNAYTKGGNRWEDMVRRSFMSGPGKELDYEEAFFETNPEYAGFGVSPDGRLFNQDGSSAGLLELKYLTPKSMEGALKKYTPQMQMQMAITGESQTHFYAYDHSTGDYIHEVVQADEEMQGKLLLAGKEAQAMAANLDARGVVALEKQIKEARKPRQRRGSSQGRAGQEAKFEGRGPEEPVTGFVSGGGSGGGGKYGGRSGASPSEPSGGQLVVTGKDLATIPDAEFREAEIEAIDETTESLRELSKSAKDAGNMLGEMMGFALAGTASGMEELQGAAARGMDPNQARGLRDALSAGNVSGAGAERLLDASTKLVVDLNNTENYERVWGGLRRTLATNTNSAAVQQAGMNLPLPGDMAAMNQRQMLSMAFKLTEGMNEEDKAYTLRAFNFGDMAIFSGTSEDLINRTGMLDVEGLKGADKAAKVLQRGKRNLEELTGSFGEEGGFVSQAGQYIGSFFNSATGAAVTGAAAYGTAKAGGVGAALSVAGGGIATTAASAAPYAAAAMPVVVAGGVAYGMTDEYAGKRQEQINTLGTDVYSQQQAGIGIDFSHLWKMISGDSSPEQVAGAIPSQSIGTMRDPNALGEQEVKVESTVNIEVNVSPDLVQTTIDDNGNIIEEGTSIPR